MYKTTVALSCANKAAVLAELWSQLNTIGWTLFDNQDGSSYRVYSSTGESGNQITGYIKINYAGTNTITVTGYYYWDSVTHAGSGGVTNIIPSVNTSESGCYLWLYGNKNLIALWTKVSSTYYPMGFGFLPKKFWTKETTLTGNAVSGNNVTLAVSSTTGFQEGSYYQIVGANNEGRDKLQVTTISDGQHLIVANLPRNYMTGAKFGQCPMAFGVLNSSFIFYNVCDFSYVGLTNYSATANTLYRYNFDTYIKPDSRGESQWVLQPLVQNEANGIDILGYIDEYIFQAANTGLNAEDTLDVGRQDAGTATSGGVNTITDTGKTWTVNQFAGLTIVISSGTGAGQIRKIISNTATEITVDVNWITQPIVGSGYVLANEAYRHMGTGFSFREGA